MPAREWKLRSFITAIMVITTLITVLLVGIAVLLRIAKRRVDRMAEAATPAASDDPPSPG